jgi:uncharacterized membrane protein YebE (DUF533 family)
VNNRSLTIMSALTLAGMVGLYVLLYRAYTKYQAAQSTPIGNFLASL